MADMWIGDDSLVKVFKTTTDDPTTTNGSVTPSGWADLAGVVLTSSDDIWINEQSGGHANTIVHMLTDDTIVEHVPRWDASGQYYDMGFDGTNLLVPDNSNAKIDFINPSSLSLVNTLDISHVCEPTGVSHRDGELWVVDAYTTGNLFRLSLAGNILDTFTGAWTEPLGIHHDGEHIWMTDSFPVSLYKIDPSDGSILSTFDLSSWAFAPTGIWVMPPPFPFRGLDGKGTSIWVVKTSVDTEEESIIKLSKDDFSEEAVLSPPSGNSGSDNPWGITNTNKDFFWLTNKLTTGSNDEIIKVDEATGSKLKQIPAPGKNTFGIAWSSSKVDISLVEQFELHLWVASWFQSSIYKFDFEGNKLQTVMLGHGASQGGDGWIVIDAGIWHAHADNLQLTLWDFDGNFVKEILGTGSADPGNLNNMTIQDLTWDETDLWVADSTNGYLHRFVIPSGNSTNKDAEETIDVDAPGVYGCAYDDGIFWITDSDSNVYTVDRTTHEVTFKFDARTTTGTSNTFMWWLDFKNDFLWGMSDNWERVWKFDPSDGSVVETLEVGQEPWNIDRPAGVFVEKTIL